MKRTGLAVIAGLLLVLLTVWCSGPACAVPGLLRCLAAEGVTLSGIELEGWAVFPGASPQQVFRRLCQQKALDLSEARPLPVGKGEVLKFGLSYPDGAKLTVLLSPSAERPDRDATGLLIRCCLTGSAGATGWECRLRRCLRQLGGEHGCYVTLIGDLPERLGPAEELDWGKRAYLRLGGLVTDSRRTAGYLSLCGYSPLLPEAVALNRRPCNLNLALVASPESRITHVYLGTPIITSEY